MWKGNNPFPLTNSQVFFESSVDEICCNWHVEAAKKIDNNQIKQFWQNRYQMQVENEICKCLLMSMLIFVCKFNHR